MSPQHSPGDFTALQKKLHAVAAQRKQQPPEINIGDDPEVACQRFCTQMKIKDQPRKEQIFRKVSKHLADLQYKNIVTLQERLGRVTAERDEKTREMEQKIHGESIKLKSELETKYAHMDAKYQAIINDYKKKVGTERQKSIEIAEGYETKLSAAEQKLIDESETLKAALDTKYQRIIDDCKKKTIAEKAKNAELIEDYEKKISSAEQRRHDESEGLKTSLDAKYQRIIDDCKTKLADEKASHIRTVEEYENRISTVEAKAESECAESKQKLEAQYNAEMKDLHDKLDKSKSENLAIEKKYAQRQITKELEITKDAEAKLTAAELIADQKLDEYRSKLTEAKAECRELKSRNTDSLDAIEDLKAQNREQAVKSEKQVEKLEELKKKLKTCENVDELLKEAEEKRRSEQYTYESKIKEISEEQRDLKKMSEESNTKWTKKYDKKLQELKHTSMDYQTEKKQLVATIADLKHTHQDAIERIQETSKLEKQREIEVIQKRNELQLRSGEDLVKDLEENISGLKEKLTLLRASEKGLVVAKQEMKGRMEELEQNLKKQDSRIDHITEGHKGDIQSLKRNHSDQVRGYESELRDAEETKKRLLQDQHNLETKLLQSSEEIQKIKKRAENDAEKAKQDHVIEIKKLEQTIKEKLQEEFNESLSSLQNQLKLQEGLARKNMEHQKHHFDQYEKQMLQTQKMEEARSAQYVDQLKAVHQNEMRDIKEEHHMTLESLQATLDSERKSHSATLADIVDSHKLEVNSYVQERERHASNAEDMAKNHAVVMKQFENEKVRNDALLRETVEEHRKEIDNIKNEHTAAIALFNSKMKDEQAAQTNAIECLKKEHAKELNDIREAHALSMEEINEKMLKEITELRESHNSAVLEKTRSLHQQHAVALGKVQADHTTSVNEMVTSYQNQIKTVRSDLETERKSNASSMKQMQEEWATKEKTLHNRHQEEIKSLNEKYMSHTEEIRAKSKEALGAAVAHVKNDIAKQKLDHEAVVKDEQEKFKNYKKEVVAEYERRISKIKDDNEEFMSRQKQYRHVQMEELKNQHVEETARTLKLLDDARAKFAEDRELLQLEHEATVNKTKEEHHKEKQSIAEQHRNEKENIAEQHAKALDTMNEKLEKTMTNNDVIIENLNQEIRQSIETANDQVVKEKIKFEDLLKDAEARAEQQKIEEMNLQREHFNEQKQGEMNELLQAMEEVQVQNQLAIEAKNKEMEDLQNGHKNLLGSFAEENERVVQEVKSKSTLKLKLNELYNYWESKQTQSFFLWHKRVLLLRHHKNLKMIEGERSLETSGFAVKLVLGKIIKHLHAVKHRAFKIWSGKIHSIIDGEVEYKSESMLACTVLTKVLEKHHNYNISVSFHIWRKATSEADAAEVFQFMEKDHSRIVAEKDEKYSNMVVDYELMRAKAEKNYTYQKYAKMVYQNLIGQFQDSFNILKDHCTKQMKKEKVIKLMMKAVANGRRSRLFLGWRKLFKNKIISRIQLQNQILKDKLKDVEQQWERRSYELIKRNIEENDQKIMKMMKVKREVLDLNTKLNNRIQEQHEKELSEMKNEMSAAIRALETKRLEEKKKYTTEIKLLHGMQQLIVDRKNVAPNVATFSKRTEEDHGMARVDPEVEDSDQNALPGPKLSSGRRNSFSQISKIKQFTGMGATYSPIQTVSGRRQTHHPGMSLPKPSDGAQLVRGAGQLSLVDAQRLASFRRRKSQIKHSSLRSTFARHSSYVKK